MPFKAFGAQGILHQINFQGKLVNSNGTNVTDGNYDITFSIYSGPSGGSPIWTEPRTGGNQVAVSGGIFRVSLGSVTTLPGSVNFNTDNLYLGITVGADPEMAPRVQFASVPQAFNAEKVNGLTVENTSNAPFTSTTVFKIAEGKTFIVNNGLTFSGTDSTTFTFPTSGGNIVTEDFTQSLTNKTIGSTGLTFAGATTDITTGTDEGLTIAPNGIGNVLVNTSAGGQAALVVNKTGLGDIFSASSAGITKFVINNDGTASSSAGFTINGTGSLQSTNNNPLSIGGGNTGAIVFPSLASNNNSVLYTSTGGILAAATTTNSNNCLISNGSGAAPSWGTCPGGSGGSNWTLSTTNGTLSPNNNTLDLLMGGTATSTARFAVLNMAGGTPTASLSAGVAGGLYLAANGTIATTAKQALNIGNSTTGGINLTSGSPAGVSISTSNSSSSIIGSISLRTGNLTGGGTVGSITLQTGIGGTNSGASGGLVSLTTGDGAVGRDLSGGSGGAISFTAGNGAAGIENACSGECGISGGNGGSLTFIAGNAATGANFDGSAGVISFTSGAGAGTSAGGAITLTTGAGGTSGASGALVLGTGTFTSGGFGTISLKQGSNTRAFIDANGLFGIGTSAPSALLNVNGGYGSNAAFILNQTNSGNIFAASVSGATKFTLTSDGTASSSAGFTINGTGSLQSTNNSPLSIGGGATGAIIFPSLASNNNSVLYTSTGGILAAATTTNSGYCFTSNGTGAAPSWGVCPGGGGGSNWTLSTANGTLSPNNNTLDFLLGGITTASAKFAVLGMNGTGPATATVSGNMIIMPQNGANGFLGIGTITPAYNIDTVVVNGQRGLNVTGTTSTTGQSFYGAYNTLSYTGGSGSPGIIAGTRNDMSITGANSANSRVYGTYNTLTLGANSNDAYGSYNTFSSAGFTSTNMYGYYNNFGTDTATAQNAYGLYNLASPGASSNSTKTGVYNKFDNIISSYGTQNVFTANIDSAALYGLVNTFSNTGAVNGTTYTGIQNTFTTTRGTGIIGLDNEITSTYTNGGTIYGVKNIIAPGGGAGAGVRTYGVYNDITNNGGGSNELAYGEYTKLKTTGTSTPKSYGYYVFDDTGSTVGTNYGFYSNLSHATANWALYIEDSSSASYFGNNAIKWGASGTADVALTRGVASQLSLTGTALFTGGNTGGLAELILNQNGVSTNDIFAASAAGVTKFVINSDGTASSSAGFTINGTGSLQSTNNNPLSIGGGNTGAIIFPSLASNNNSVLYTSTGGILAAATTTNSGYCLTSNGTGAAPSWGVCPGGGGGSNWTLSTANGTLSPNNNTLDLLMGGTATSTAKFAVLGIAGATTPVASISAQNVLGQALVLGGDGTIQGLRNNTLTFGGGTTGNIFLNPLNDSTLGHVGIGMMSQYGTLSILQKNDNTGGILFTSTLSDSVTKQGRIKTLSYLNAQPPVTGLIMSNQITDNRIMLGGGSASENAITALEIYAAANNTTLTGTLMAKFTSTGLSLGSTSAGSNLSPANGLLVDGFAGFGTTNQTVVAPLDIYNDATDINGEKLVLRRNGAGDVGLSFQQNTVSAFGIVNRSGSGNGLAFVDNYYEGSNGTEIARFYAASGVGIGTLGALPTGTLDVRGAFANSGTQPIATFSAKTSFAGLLVDNSGTGDLVTASSSGVMQFVLSNSGMMGLGVSLPTARLDVLGSASISGNLTFRAGAGFIQTTANSPLSIGGGNTGAIVLPGFASNNNSVLYTGTGGILGAATTTNTGNCLVSNGTGAAPTWGSCGGSVEKFDILNGLLFNANQSTDFAIGGNSSTSAELLVSMSGTKATASISANTSFAGLVIDQSGLGDIFTASSSGLARFTIANSGDVIIGNSLDAGYKLDVKGTVRIGNNSTTDDIVKASTTDFTQSGYAVSTTDGVNNVTTSGNQLKLVTDLLGAGAALTATAAGQATGTNVTTGSLAFQRPDKKFVVFVGGATTSRIYDASLDQWTAGPATAGLVSLAAGAQAFQKSDGNFVIIHGGTTSTTIYQPGGSNNFGTVVVGPVASGTVGAGSLLIRRTDGKVLVVHGNNGTTSSVYDPTAGTGTTSIGSFQAGPATSANVTTGSFAIPRPDGKWLIGHGGAQTTSIYDPSIGVGGSPGGSFSAGPTWTAITATNSGAGAHVIQLPDGRFLIFLGGGSGLTLIYNPVAATFSAGPTLAAGDFINSGAHSFQRSDGKWVVVIGSATNSKTLQLYDPSANSFSQMTAANGLQGATGAGPGALTFQRPDGKYMIIHGATTQLTTLADAGWNTTGTWTSEDISSTTISTYSAMIWSANPQSANNNARLDSETINFAVKTGDTLTTLGNNSYRVLQDSGDLIKAYGNSLYAKIQVTFTVPVRSYVTGATGYINQSNIWSGEGGTFYRRSFIQPTVFSMRIQNPLASYGDPSGQGDPAFGRNFATGSALLEGVVTDNSNRLSLAPLRNFPNASSSAGFIIASASANLGGSAGAGAHTIERNNGQFLTILGNASNLTRVYDVDTNLWSTGPTLPSNAGAGAHSFLLPDGRFFVVLGGGAIATGNKTAIFDPQSNLFIQGPDLLGNVGSGANTFQRPDGFFIILNAGNTNLTNILDPFTMSVTKGPFTVAAIGNGSMNIRRFDGRIIVLNGQAATGTSIYDPATNAFAAGPTLTTAPTTGSTGAQLPNGRFFIKTTTTVSIIYDPVANSSAAGPTANATVAAGGFMIPRSDGKVMYGAGAVSTVADPIVAAAATGPALPCTTGAGGHVFQRQTGEYMVVCGGGTANTFIVDSGWNLGGTYTTEQIYEPLLSGTTSVFWKNSGQGEITVKYRTASTQVALGLAAWKDAATSGSYISPASGDVWIQFRYDLQGELQDLPGAKTRVWLASDSGGGMQYYRQVQAPILQYWKLMNIQDPTLLTLTSGGSNVFRFSSDGQAYTSDTGSWNSGGADLAERYQSKETLQAGEVVTLDKINPTFTKRSTNPYDPNLMGVVSTQPGFVAGAYTEDSYPVALVGRVPVKVSNENGQIHAGDYLTSASIPGYAMKATYTGRVIGQAMENFDATTAVDCPRYGAGSLPATQCGTITVFVNIVNYTGEGVEAVMQDKGFDALSDNTQQFDTGLNITNSQGRIAIIGNDLTSEQKKQQAILSFLRTQRNNAITSEIFTDRLSATHEVIAPQIVTDLLIAKKIKADSIEGLEFLIGESVKGLSGLGSSASGQLTASTSADAVHKFSANDIVGLPDLISSLIQSDVKGIATSSGQATVVPDGLIALGPTTLGEATIMDRLTVGAGFIIEHNAINTLGTDIEIQSLKQGGVSFLGGLVTISTDGVFRVAGQSVFDGEVIFNQTATFISKAIFRNDVEFEKTPTVGHDTAGSVVIKKGEDRVVVKFDNEYRNTPLINATLEISEVKLPDGTVEDSTVTEQRILSAGYTYVISKKTTYGFNLVLDKKADEDLTFSWTAVQVKTDNANNTTSQSVLNSSSSTGSLGGLQILGTQTATDAAH